MAPSSRRSAVAGSGRCWGRCRPCARGARALDLECGSGILSTIPSGFGCQVTGVDFSEAMLKEAAANVEAHGVAGLAGFEVMDVHALSFADNSFDLVVSRNVTWVLENVGQVYREVLRVLKPGGMFVNIDGNYGAAFRAAEARGEVPVHPTQTLDQLLERNAIVRDLPITAAERPLWDVATLWELGASYVGVHRDFEAMLGSDGGTSYRSASAGTRAEVFMLEAYA